MNRPIKSFCFLCIALLAFALTGCSASGTSGTKPSKTAKSQETAANVKKDDSKIRTELPASEGNRSSQTQTATNKSAAAAKQPAANTNTGTAAKPAATKKSSTVSKQPTQTNSGTAEKTSTAQSITPKPAAPSNTVTPTKPANPPKATTPAKPAAVVTLTIAGPKDRGTILAADKYNFKDGDSVFDVLLSVSKKHHIVVDSKGSGATTYIEGIDNIYEFDYGAKSGWIFKLNGVSLTKSIGLIKVKDGDRIECIYTE